MDIESILVIVLIVVVFACLAAAVIMGFWMGRQTISESVRPMTLINKTGGQPLFEEDPYADAARDMREKSEGSL